MIKPVILCGGSGTRLWPLSRRSLPKQFVPLLGEHSLLELTLARLVPLAQGEELFCVSADEHRFLVADALRAQGAVVAEVILEPAARRPQHRCRHGAGLPARPAFRLPVVLSLGPSHPQCRSLSRDGDRCL